MSLVSFILWDIYRLNLHFSELEIRTEKWKVSIMALTAVSLSLGNTISKKNRKEMSSKTRDGKGNEKRIEKRVVKFIIVLTGTSLSCIRLLGLVFWNLIHLEVASDSFCFLWNCSWLLVFILYVFFMIFLGFNLYCWKGIHFS